MINSMRKPGPAFVSAALLMTIIVAHTPSIRVTHASTTVLTAVTTFDPVTAKTKDGDKDKDKNKSCPTKPCPKS
jgi:hypothetical protein